MMYFKQITVTGLGCNSSVIGCPGARQAVVAGPNRDVQDYMDISRDEWMKITPVIETHVHSLAGGLTAWQNACYALAA